MRLYTTGLVKKYKTRTVVNHVSIDNCVEEHTWL